MTKVICGVSTSLDGFIAGAGDSPEQPLGTGGDRLFQWFSDGDTPSRDAHRGTVVPKPAQTARPRERLKL